MKLNSLRNRPNTRFEDGSYDLRGFEVRTRTDNENIGRVDDLLIGPNGHSRYLSVEMNDESAAVLVPCGAIKTDRSKSIAWIKGMRGKDVRGVPSFDRDVSSIDEDYERRVAAAYDEGNPHEPYDRYAYEGRGWGRGEKEGTIERVDRLENYRVAKGDPDPRGWTVYGHDGNELGKVEHLIGDTAMMKVLYLDIRVEPKLVDDKRHVLVPAGYVALNRKNERVRVDALNQRRITERPKYTRVFFGRDYERKLRDALSSSFSEDRRYEHPRYNDHELFEEERMTRTEEELRVGKNERKAGSVKVQKKVETERVEEPVELYHEEVDVERRPANATHDDADRGFWIQEDGRRLFVVLDPRNLETPYEVESNNRVMIENAEVRNGDQLDDISGQLSAETRDMATQQRVFLLADGQDVDLLAAR